MEIEIPKGVSEILFKLQESGFESYIVGGAVRDILMGKSVYDWDLTTNATPDDMAKIFTNSYYTNDYGMVGIPNEVEDERPYEVTTFRTEHGYSDSRRPDKVSWGKSLSEDLSRRDFTINAMALKVDASLKPHSEKYSKKGQTTKLKMDLIDPYDGQGDLNSKLIRAVGDPNNRFSEDALRMMRAVRIAAEIGLSIEEKTLSAIQKNCNLIEKISKERIRDEFLKTLSSKNPHDGILILKNTGLMHFIIPELESCFGVQQASPGRHHIYDVGTHLVMSLKFVSEKNPDPIVRLATLIHDVGKSNTYKKLDSGVITFYNHEIFSARSAKAIAERLRFSNKDKDKLWKLVRFHQFTLDEKQTDSAVRRFIRNVGKEYIDDMLDLRVGDRLGGGARETSWRFEEFKKRIIEVQKQPFSISDLRISGNDVMKTLEVPSGPKVGEILKVVFEKVVNKKLKNDKKEQIKFLKEIKVSP